MCTDVQVRVTTGFLQELQKHMASGRLRADLIAQMKVERERVIHYISFYLRFIRVLFFNLYVNSMSYIHTYIHTYIIYVFVCMY